MLTNALYSALQKTESPRTARALSWMLSKSTGYSTGELLSPNWYAENGYNRLAQYGNSSWSGGAMSKDRALGITAFFAGVKLISEDLGALPFHTYERSKDHKRVDKAYTHPLYQTLHDLWNPEISAGEGVEALTSHALITGTGYAEIQRFGKDVYLWPWQAEDVTTDRNAKGVQVYLRRDGGGAQKTYSREQVFTLRGFTMDGTCGESILYRMRGALGISSAAEEYAGRFFSQDAAPGIVVSFPAGVPALNAESVSAFKEAWKKWHQGLASKHEPAVVQHGGTVTRVGFDNEESQLLQVRQHQLTEVCRVLRIPPHKLADLARSTNNNIEHQGIEYVVDCINPWIDRWRRSVYRCLLSFDEQRAGQIYAEMDVAGLQRGDFATQAEGWRKLLEKGVYSINEVRRWQNLNPVDGGDEHFIQLNLGTVQDVASGLTLAANKTGTMPVA